MGRGPSPRGRCQRSPAGRGPLSVSALAVVGDVVVRKPQSIRPSLVGTKAGRKTADEDRVVDEDLTALLGQQGEPKRASDGWPDEGVTLHENGAGGYTHTEQAAMSVAFSGAFDLVPKSPERS